MELRVIYCRISLHRYYSQKCRPFLTAIDVILESYGEVGKHLSEVTSPFGATTHVSQHKYTAS